MCVVTKECFHRFSTVDLMCVILTPFIVQKVSNIQVEVENFTDTLLQCWLILN